MVNSGVNNGAVITAVFTQRRITVWHTNGYKGWLVKGIMNAELPRQVALNARNCYGCETAMVSSGVQKHCSIGKTITKTILWDVFLVPGVFTDLLFPFIPV